MNVLVVGSGGREHALAWKIAQDNDVKAVFVAPGNAGTATDEKLQNVAIDVMEFEKLAQFAKENDVSLTVIGPEAPLVEGIVDYFETQGLACFGPSKGAAQLEGSKAFTKDFLARHHIPTADYQNFTQVDEALAYLKKVGAPIVVKADGLAAGKGVIVAMTLDEAEAAVKDMLSGNAFGEAGCRVVIEEFLTGEEASFIVIADGEDCIPMATSQDHKRVGDGDTGPNTGGMGAYSPAPVVTQEIHNRIMEQVINPTLKGMKSEGNRYRGFLYAGLMITSEGQPKVIEFNCRFGDPETQPIMMRLISNLAPLCSSAISGTLNQESPIWNDKPAVGVVLAAGGYPGSYKKALPIEGLEKAKSQNGKVFHAGTSLEENQVVTSGGRVLCATALGDTVSEAAQAAYTLANNIDWKDMFYRKDIAYRAIEREQQNER
ncbi:phosphoribosylamine--glycine ligase [Oleiphilus sp. HI0071]|jgi:phosphoribosylamine--glycine ligase|uniref:phosphoribosylamine--glycine ligase n=3 Tax=unclassified Oleiphilus TaxID=2631174 RepID=UPI0007C39A2D|nr:phosphoribosylamine--glycine ligase [Oleiphilus sp. HI0079]KZY68299.1 phosphoribosylamine--glycine ligase [Oleiphilus sp. HI0065]KZY83475.1 phosphoribosylamine--glycine ligase [Oleiphilus sp. HI0071]KZZ06368.1 phosphoribosylamine--glycine ligase [Oleiphilus sp. HI0073]KZZ42883.1 phosphoribosylamine--glycine ligase [Oleiphilus sp. HI0118]KZZ50236.1 phosphoribosylamine--glycine ligase [Oleiphilus sp. HI0122]KZZ71538.1 phosphoribosylamine--glycine ligase [Oleiphilus sp. HI0130]KZZ78135.1 pho